ncbi:nitrite reductase/ring-hydroxylating ferredoxin subunit/Fe-S cluster biogenesis protein NfuA [Kineosphaera limosa]|uniref:Putative iron-sulfur protein n=1 Tax=Kineosphaera limosa NBRC 100340 TaxID=1184609 RepID=K6VPI5_9MICO|nr:Rieske 2Fe-2S domain-containing protein [Kineosphaera limosa]NYE00208.1 nitrite reductase/ring-hydroxylating ferredoxin subunit/Fe-S cluster biogenesis protein NfuA [Kineosphaera limosa]GAB98133.1 putative iron-sulfur protein [Kineosphaera limosa NBRC 100340]
MSEQTAIRPPTTVGDETTAQAPVDEGALEALARTLDEGEPAQQLAAFTTLHRQALVTIVRRLREDPSGKELLFELVDDPHVHMMLAVHGIVRADPTTRARQILEAAKPVLTEQKCSAELLTIDEGVIRLRFDGPSGCDSPTGRLKPELEAALLAGIPAVRSVVYVDPPRAPVLLGGIGLRPDATPSAPADPGPGWVRTFPVERITPGSLEAVSLRRDAEQAALSGSPGSESTEAIIVNAAGRFTAYVNSCAHQGLPLDEAEVDAARGTITCPWHGLCFDAVEGECLTLPGARLQPLDLQVLDGHIWVKVA